MFLSNIILPSYLDDDCDYEAQEHGASKFR